MEVIINKDLSTFCILNDVTIIFTLDGKPLFPKFLSTAFTQSRYSSSGGNVAVHFTVP